MADQNFKVKNGLTVGNLAVDTSGNITTTSGNITLAPFAGANVVVTGNLVVNSVDIRAAIDTVSNAISVVSVGVDRVSNALSNEISNRASADNALSNSISIVSNALSNEISNRNSAVNAVSNALSNEISNRGSAVNIVSNALSAEIVNRVSTVALKANLASPTFTGTVGGIAASMLTDVTIATPTNNQLLVYNSTTTKWTNTSGITGPQGTTGANGANGAQGTQGTTGTTGTTGTQGTTGTTGTAGTQGSTGPSTAINATAVTTGTYYPVCVASAGTNQTPSIRTTATAFSIDMATNTLTTTATQANYADLAEKYITDVEYDFGTVVIFGGEQEITLANISHDVRIAGVISKNPGYLMNTSSNGQAVALTGRVPCKVIGPVSKGDRMVASSRPGYAMVLDMSSYQPGCVIGKALENFNGDFGIIEVVVGRV